MNTMKYIRKHNLKSPDGDFVYVAAFLTSFVVKKLGYDDIFRKQVND